MLGTHHASLVVGTSGRQGAEFARRAAAALFCAGEGDRPCGQCRPCTMLGKGLHPDFCEIAPKGSTLKLGQITELVGEVYARPALADHKVFVIHQVDRMTPEAANAFLKTLEEPPEYAVFLLVTENPEQLLPTIRSRCQTLRLEAPGGAEAVRAISSATGCLSAEAEFLARYTGGQVAVAAELYGSSAFARTRRLAVELLAQLADYEEDRLLGLAEELDREGQVAEFLSLLAIAARDALVFRLMGPGAQGLLWNADYQAQIGAASRHEPSVLALAVGTAQAAAATLRSHVNPRLAVEATLLAVASAAWSAGSDRLEENS
ncbi:MAG: ATP-binding protein [Bacillota bacterium]